MAVLWSSGTVLKDVYVIKRVFYEGRFYNFYIAQNRKNPGFQHQIIQFHLSKIPPRQKMMSEEEFIACVDLLKDISHPNIPSVTDGFFHEGNPCLVSSHSDGITLERIIDMQMSPFTLDDAMEKINQYIDALYYLYNRPFPFPFIHIDTPHVLLTSDGKILLMGFGLHIFLDHYLSSTDPDAFCAPEIIEGKTFSIPSAIYSISALFYYLITKRKWNGSRKDNPLPRDLVGDIPDALQQVLVKGLSKNPDQRFLDLPTFKRKLSEAVHPPTRTEVAVAPRKEEQLFEADLKLLGRKLRLVALSILTIVTLIILSIIAWDYLYKNKTTFDSEFAYVLDKEGKSVSCVNLKTGIQDKIIPVPGECLSMTLSHNGKRLYLSCLDKTIKIVDTRKRTVIKTCALQKTPGRILLLPEETNSFVLIRDEPLIIMWNPVSCEIIKEIKINSKEFDAVMSIDGGYLYVLDCKKAEILIIDSKKGNSISSFPVNPGPQEVIVEKTGNYVLISSMDGTIQFFDTKFNSLIKSVAIEKGAMHMIASRNRGKDNLIFVACEEGRNVYIIDCASFLLSQKAATKGIPVDLREGPEGKILYVLCSDPEALILYNAGNLKQIKQVSSGLSRPKSLVVWP